MCHNYIGGGGVFSACHVSKPLLPRRFHLCPTCSGGGGNFRSACCTHFSASGFLRHGSCYRGAAIANEIAQNFIQFGLEGFDTVF
jgi:hypothetical protein